MTELENAVKRVQSPEFSMKELAKHPKYSRLGIYEMGIVDCLRELGLAAKKDAEEAEKKVIVEANILFKNTSHNVGEMNLQAGKITVLESFWRACGAPVASGGDADFAPSLNGREARKPK